MYVLLQRAKRWLRAGTLALVISGVGCGRIGYEVAAPGQPTDGVPTAAQGGPTDAGGAGEVAVQASPPDSAQPDGLPADIAVAFDSPEASPASPAFDSHEVSPASPDAPSPLPPDSSPGSPSPDVAGPPDGPGIQPDLQGSTPTTAIALVGVQSMSAGATTNVAWPHAIGDGSGLYLVVTVALRRGAGVTTPIVTVNGARPPAIALVDWTNNCVAGLWGLAVSPGTVASISVETNRPTDIVAGSRLYSGVDTANPITNTSGYLLWGHVTSIEVTVPRGETSAAELIVDGFAIYDPVAVTAGPGQSVSWDRTVGSIRGIAGQQAGAANDVAVTYGFPSGGSACLAANSLNAAVPRP